MFTDEKHTRVDRQDVDVDETAEDPASGPAPSNEGGAADGAPDPSGQIASGGNAEGPEADHPADPTEHEDEVVVEGRSPEHDPHASKAAKKQDKGKRRHGPSQKEVLERLLEKNEVILQLTKKNVELEAKAKDLENKRIRLAAEFENYRKRTRKEWELLKDQTKAEVLSEVLNVADDFERAFAAVEDRDDDFVKGIRLIYNNLTSILEGFGLQRMSSLGELFDPNLHMAVATIESRNVEPNHIVEVIQEGYLMGETVVRIAKVVIAK